MNLRAVRRLLRRKQYSVSVHAYQEARADGLEAEDVLYALRHGEIIERYRARQRCLVLGFTAAGVAVHVVCDLGTPEHLRIVTVYLPDPDQWQNFRVR